MGKDMMMSFKIFINVHLCQIYLNLNYLKFKATVKFDFCHYFYYRVMPIILLIFFLIFVLKDDLQVLFFYSILYNTSNYRQLPELIPVSLNNKRDLLYK